MTVLDGSEEQIRPGVPMRELVRQATGALIAMDADRLEDLARCCADLIREVETTGNQAEVTAAVRDAKSELRLLDCVLYETRTNLTVLRRLHALRLQEVGWYGNN